MTTPMLEAKPGTVAAAQPPPQAVDDAKRLLGDGGDLDAAVERLAALRSTEELRAAQLWWVRRMPKASWDDHQAGAVLRVLERALARTNRLVR